jgi:hypothetical protein
MHGHEQLSCLSILHASIDVQRNFPANDGERADAVFMQRDLAFDHTHPVLSLFISVSEIPFMNWDTENITAFKEISFCVCG